MSIATVRDRQHASVPIPVVPWPIVGTLCVVTPEGVPFVDYPGNACGPLPARVISTVDAATCVPGVDVVLLFEDQDAQRPVVAGVVSDRVPPATKPSVAVNRTDQDVVIDGRRLVLEGHDEIVLRCGRGSITLTANGKIILKGTELVSRSSGANKIRGAVVNIN